MLYRIGGSSARLHVVKTTGGDMNFRLLLPGREVTPEALHGALAGLAQLHKLDLRKGQDNLILKGKPGMSGYRRDYRLYERMGLPSEVEGLEGKKFAFDILKPLVLLKISMHNRVKDAQGGVLHMISLLEKAGIQKEDKSLFLEEEEAYEVESGLEERSFGSLQVTGRAFYRRGTHVYSEGGPEHAFLRFKPESAVLCGKPLESVESIFPGLYHVTESQAKASGFQVGESITYRWEGMPQDAAYCLIVDLSAINPVYLSRYVEWEEESAP